MRSGRQAEHGFTLIELIVVIAVIAILSAFLFPVFAQARERGRQIVCLSNLRHIGAATIMYLRDYDDTFPAVPPLAGNWFLWSLWVPGPDGTWEQIRTGCCGNVGRHNVTARLFPYVRSTQVFFCPNDPNGDRWADSGNLWDSRIARRSYFWHYGLGWGATWSTYPRGRPGGTGRPWSHAALQKPMLLPLVLDWPRADSPLHPINTPDQLRLNVCYADGHARFTRMVDLSVPVERAPLGWNLNNPTRPVDVETPCQPTCAAEAKQD